MGSITSLTTVSEPGMVALSRLGRAMSWQGRQMSYEAPDIRLLGTVAELTEGGGETDWVPNGSPLREKPDVQVITD